MRPRAAVFSLLLLLIVVLFLNVKAAAQSDSQDQSGSLIVTITDATTGKPIDNADVYLLGGESPTAWLSDASGLAIFAGLAPAYYRVRVEADGYASTRTADLDLSPGQKLAIIVKLAPNLSVLKTIASVVVRTSDVFVVDVTSESAQRMVSQNLADALDKVAGVSVSNELYGPNSAFSIALRGADPSQTGYQINGVQVTGNAAQTAGVLQDLFTGASISFAPSALGPAGTVNFYTLQPTRLWSYGFFGSLGNYGLTNGSWNLAGGSGKMMLSLQHSVSVGDSPLDGLYYQDQTGNAYEHAGGYVRNSNLFAISTPISQVSTIRYTMLQGLANSTYICASATTLLPCSDGPESTSGTSTTSQSFNFGSLLGHWIYNLNASYSVNRNQQAEPNRAVNGMLDPLFSSSANNSFNLSTSLDKLVRRHTISASVFVNSESGVYSSTYNVTRSVANAVAYRTVSAELSNAVKANDKLRLQYSISHSSGTGTGSTVEAFTSASWRPQLADSFNVGIGIGSSNPGPSIARAIGDPLTAQYDCFNGSVFVAGPNDQPTHQTSLNYNVGWNHVMKQNSFTLQAFRTDLGGQAIQAAVPIAGEPPNIFPNNSLAQYLGELENTWAQPTVCGSAPFDPAHVYVTQLVSGETRISQGFTITGRISLGKTVLLVPSYAITDSYYSTLDPRLLLAGSYYGVGVQVPRVPLARGGLILQGLAPHSWVTWSLNAQYTSANNPANQPAYTIYNGSLSLRTARGNFMFYAGNIFGAHTGLFSTYQGINALPTQGGGSFALATTPLPPRSFSVQYQIRGQQHVKPLPPTPGLSVSSPSPKPSPR